MHFSESTGPTEATLPVDLGLTQSDENLTNFTRSDANCDKTGTCYDGKIIASITIVRILDE